MCGIIGAIGNFDSSAGITAVNAIKHRGPDDQGSFEYNNVFFGHTRLSILDLSTNGHQPMISSDDNIAIVFNGEIYNHLDIRKDALADTVFKSTSDTETILYGYKKYGVGILNMLNGIFALAILDKEKSEVIVARDQMGVKPLYIYQDENRILFGSEIKSLLNFDINKEINIPALAGYINYLWSPGTATPFKHVKKVLAGTYVKIRLGNVNVPENVRYYEVPFNGKYTDKTEGQLVDDLDNILQKAVERQMLSDVPVGFFLSGGLDSSLLVAIARKLHPDKRFECFTIDTPEIESAEGFVNDLHYAKKVAKHLDVDLNIIEASIDILSDFDLMIWHLDEPQADAAPLNVLKIAEAARKKGIKVLIGGTAGDDLFSGYRRHQALSFEKYFSLIPPFLGVAIKKAANFLPVKVPLFRRLRKLVSDLEKKQSDRLIGFFSWIDDKSLQKLFAVNHQNLLLKHAPSKVMSDLLQQIPDEKSILNQMLFLEMRTFLVDHNLNYTDKLSMAVGVESRVPYLDMELVEFAAKIPPGLKMKGKTVKYVLKKVAERYLPMDVIYRPKTGFGAPVRKWITQDLSDIVDNKLSPESINRRGIFNADEVQQLIKRNKEGKIDASYTVWSLLAVESWMAQFAD